MKPKTVIILALVFLVLQTTYKVWAIYTSIFGMFIFLGLAGIFLIFIFILLYQLFLVLKAKFKERDRIVSSLVLAGSLSLVAMFPRGLVERDWFRADDVLLAWQEGGGNCHMYLAFKNDNTFVETGYCFGVSESTGTYTMSGDTIFFGDDSDSEYIGGYAILYKNEGDTFSGLALHRKEIMDGYPMQVSLDKLSKK